MARTVLMVAYYFPPLGLAGVQRLSKLAKYLPQCGYNVEVLTVKSIRYAAFDKTLLEELPPQVKIFRSGSRDPERIMRFLPFRIRAGSRLKAVAKNRAGFWPDAKIGWMRPAVRLGTKLIERGEIDIIFSSSPPVTAHLIAMELANRFRIPWVADFRDIWESRPPEQIYDNTELIEKSNRLLEKIGRTAQAVTAINDTIARRIAPEGKVMAGGYDTEDFSGLTYAHCKDQFQMCYLGTVNSLHPIEPFFEAARAAAQADAEFAGRFGFVILGANDRSSIMKTAAKYDLAEKVQMVDYLPHRAALQAAGEAAVTLLSVPEGHPDVMTGKIFDLLALPAPILASVPIPGEAESLINRYQGGICVPSNRKDLLVEKMQLLYRHQQDGVIWRKRDLSSLTRLEAARQLAEILDGAIASGA